MTRLRHAVLTSLAFSVATLMAQAPSRQADLSYKGLIQIPNWTTTGATAESVDLANYDPVTSLLYYADHVQHGIIAIDTKTNSFLGWVPIPNCTGSCPSGIQVAPNIRKLVATDRATHIYIFDLNLPNTPPASVTVPTAIDELDYDPVHRRVYIGNTTAPYYLTGVDLDGPNANTVVAQIPLPGAPEQARFNPVDGMIYLTVPSVGVLKFDPDGGDAGTGALVATYTINNCSGNGNWIDPVTNTMLVGCNNVAGEAVVSLTDGSVLMQWPAVNRDDIVGWNPALRRWYTGSGSNTNNPGVCPPTNTGTTFPVMGVFAAGTATDPTPSMVGVMCSGRGGSTIAVDPIHSNVYIPVAQYPLDPATTASGQPGIMVFHDSTPFPPTPAASRANLGQYGTVDFILDGRQMDISGILYGVQDGLLELVVTTTAGNEVVSCASSGGIGACYGNLIGDPMIGGSTLVANNKKVVASGPIQLMRYR